MKIEKMYKYKKDGVVIIGGVIPQDAELITEMDILIADKGKKLIKDGLKKPLSSVWLRNGDSQENYEEVEIKNE